MLFTFERCGEATCENITTQARVLHVTINTVNLFGRSLVCLLSNGARYLVMLLSRGCYYATFGGIRIEPV